MYNLGMVMIGGSGGGPRASLFSNGFVDNFGLSGSYLGQADAQQSYVKAKAEIAEFDQLVNRTKKIANKMVREQIALDNGLNDPSNSDKAMYMRNALASDVASADAHVPVAYEEGFPSHGPSRGRVTKLNDFLSDFRHSVENAEAMYDTLPEPQIIEKIVTVSGTNWAIPAVVLAGGIGMAAILGLFSGK
jgi:hypothetical protein